jgi:hypothetical protein
LAAEHAWPASSGLGVVATGVEVAAGLVLEEDELPPQPATPQASAASVAASALLRTASCIRDY